MSSCQAPRAAASVRVRDLARQAERPSVGDATAASDFERLLSARRGCNEEGEERRDDASTPADAAMPNPAASFALAMVERAPAVESPRAAARGAVEVAPQAVQAEPALDLESEAVRSFEVTIAEPGVPLAMHAERAAGARWNLSIASTGLNPALLRRYSERLDARLRGRAVSHEPVRIEDDDDDTAP